MHTFSRQKQQQQSIQFMVRHRIALIIWSCITVRLPDTHSNTQHMFYCLVAATAAQPMAHTRCIPFLGSVDDGASIYVWIFIANGKMEAATTNNNNRKKRASAERTTWKLIKMLINCSFWIHIFFFFTDAYGCGWVVNAYISRYRCISIHTHKWSSWKLHRTHKKWWNRKTIIFYELKQHTY